MIATMRDESSVAELVERAKEGDQFAWDQIVERYATLVWSVCRRHGLTGADADDVGASVWLRLVERLGTIREPAALPGWLRTTTQRECLHLLRAKSRQIPVADEDRMVNGADPASDEWLLTQELHIALRQAFAQLPDRCQELLSMLFDDPSKSYAEIGAKLGMTTGGIGPNRMRCLEKLRRNPVIAALLERGERHA